MSERTQDILDDVQKRLGCFFEDFAGADVFTKALVLDALVPQSILHAPEEVHPRSPYYLYDIHTGASDLFPHLHTFLSLPAHASIRALHRYTHADEPYWTVTVYCEQEPYPPFGWDTCREAEGIWTRWFPMQSIRCHGIGKG